MASDEASARSAVDHQQADVALIIPANFTQAALTSRIRKRPWSFIRILP